MTPAPHRRFVGRALILFTEQAKAGLEETCAAKVLRRVGENLCATLSANAVGSLHFDGSTIGLLNRTNA
jgi:hypothetical protein